MKGLKIRWIGFHQRMPEEGRDGEIKIQIVFRGKNADDVVTHIGTYNGIGIPVELANSLLRGALSEAESLS